LVTIAHQTSGLSLYGKQLSGPTNAPTAGMSEPSGDARYPVIAGSKVAGLDLLGTSISLNGAAKTLTIKDKVLDLSSPAATAAQIPGTSLLQYVNRWQMGNTIYYAAMSNSAANQPMFYAGAAESVDLCSVSACDPHVLTYPEASLGGTPETGGVKCPTAPSVSDPCTITITVNTADVGNPTGASSLQEVGTYAFAASHPQGATTNAQAQANNLPLEIDGACCFNDGAPVGNSVAGAGPPHVSGAVTETTGGIITPGTEPVTRFW
jgi:hypothetical protein